MPLVLLRSHNRIRKGQIAGCLQILCMSISLSLLVIPRARAAEPRESGQNTPDRAQNVPSWMDQAIFYEIFPRAFSSEGTLNGVTARLDTLQKLGVNVLWFINFKAIW